MTKEPEVPTTGRAERGATPSQRRIIRRITPVLGEGYIEHVEPDPDDLERLAEQVRNRTAAVFPRGGAVTDIDPTIVEFIRARLDEDEQYWQEQYEEVRASARRTGKTAVTRGLRGVEAKRAILDLHGRMAITPQHPQFNDAHLTTEPMVICRSCEPERMFRRTHSWPCRTLRALASEWSDHEDYQEGDRRP